MRKLPEVEAAKTLMNEATDWSVMKWLKEKKRVRRAADRANEVLDALNRQTKESWAAELKAAYDELKSSPRAGSTRTNGHGSYAKLAEAIKRADETARRARQDAEDTFDEAERQFSTRLAREGCKKAVTSWELHEAAIRKAEKAAS